MEKQSIDDALNTESTANTPSKNGIRIPIIAIGLDLLPFLLGFLSVLLPGQTSFVFLLMILSPIAGMIMGIASLFQRKGHIGIAGKILAIIAIIIPLAMVAIIFFVVMPAIIVSM